MSWFNLKKKNKQLENENRVLWDREIGLTQQNDRLQLDNFKAGRTVACLRSERENLMDALRLQTSGTVVRPKPLSWISTSVRLPAEGKYVLARHNRGSWIDKGDPENVNCVVVKLVRGISKKEREESGEKTYVAADEWDNNLVSYNWEQFGPDSFFGQTITHWLPIPQIKKAPFIGLGEK